MSSLTEFFNIQPSENIKGITHKNNIIKRNIIAYMAVNGECTLSELTKELHISVPTITKLVQELIDENIVNDLGKVETPGGRRPNVFGLANTAIYFAGINVGRDHMTYVVTDLQNNVISEKTDNTFELVDRPQCLERICQNVEAFVANCGVDREKILGVGVSMVGRVNPETGRSYKYFTSSEESLTDIISSRIGIRVMLENDTRARCYAEYTTGKSKNESNVLYLHMGRGVAIGIVIDGKLYYGKNGFAGEFGHIPFFDNEIICGCGKKGCLEQYTSATGIVRSANIAISNTDKPSSLREVQYISAKEVFDAAKKGDELAAQLVENHGKCLGKALAQIACVVDPEVFVIGGGVSKAGEIITDTTEKYFQEYAFHACKKTQFKLATLGNDAGMYGGACAVLNK